MPTIQDVAKAAGVSVATVSRVLSNPEVVAESTRLKVLAVVKSFNYMPNAAAKSLRTARSGRILVTVPDISNPFFSQVIRGVEEAARQEGQMVVLVDTRHDPEEEARHGMMLMRREADGLIFLGHTIPASVMELVTKQGACAPVVNGCEYSPALGVSSAHIDNRAAAHDMMAHLYSLGHRTIGIVTGPMISPLSRDRLAGAEACATECGGARELVVMAGDFSIESGARAAQALLTGVNRPTAIFCFSDEMAIGALHIAKRLNLRVPEDVAIAGFDDIRFCEYLDPPLTTISQPALEIGRETIRLLMAILRGQSREPVSTTLPHSLIIRESTIGATVDGIPGHRRTSARLSRKP